EDFAGTASTQFRAWDGSGAEGGTADTFAEAAAFASAYELATIAVAEVNDAPVAFTDQLARMDAGETRTISAATLLANDSPGPANESGQRLTLVGIVPGSAVGCTVATTAAGGVQIVAADGFDGYASFRYLVADDGTTGGLADARTVAGEV